MYRLWRLGMLKPIALTVLFLSASSFAYAQTASPSPPANGASSPIAGSTTNGNLNAVDFGALTDARVDMIKAALQLSPDQEKYWSAIEAAIRARAANRQNRISEVEGRTVALRDQGVVQSLRNRDPVAFLQRRADALAQRSTDLRKLADAWQPLYQTMSSDQKRRMGLLAIYVVRELRSGAEQNRLASEDNGD
jgi:hypothetical protein